MRDWHTAGFHKTPESQEDSSLDPSSLELKCYRNPALSFSAISNNCHGNSSTSKKEGDSQRQMLAMLYTKDNDILQNYTILQWWISLVFLSNRTQAARSKYLLDLYQSMCHIYKVIFSPALGRKANAALDFCLQGLKSLTLDRCHPPPLTQDLSCTEECLFICCCTARKRGRSCMAGGTDENNSQEIG